MPLGSARGINARICWIKFFLAFAVSLLSADALFSSASAAARARFSVSSPDDAADIRSARESFDTGDYATARKTLEAALEKTASDPEIHFWLGRCFYELSEFNSAAASFERALQLQPRNSLYHQWLGRTYSEKADRDHSLSLARKTKKEFQSAVQLDPSNISARRDLAQYEVEAPWIAGGDKDDARIQVEAIAARDPVDGSLARAMYVFHVEKKPAQAEELYRQVLQDKPQHIQPYFEAARFFQYHGSAANLETAIQGATAIDPLDLRLDYFRGVTLYLAGNDLPGAERFLSKYVSGAPQRSDWPFPADAREWLGRTLEAEGKRAEAIVQYREALRLEPRRKIARERLSKLEKSSE